MPYAITREDGHYIVKKRDTGEVVGKTRSKANADAMIRAIYANETKDK